jgi:hypothetical protein
VAESAAFEAACNSLEQSSSLDRLAARGTIRLALKQAGLDAKSVTAQQLVVVVKRLLPAELTSRGVADPDSLCTAIARALEGVAGGAAAETPEAVFQRLGGGS